jgi:release factor glutamine methyltransferase
MTAADLFKYCLQNLAQLPPGEREAVAYLLLEDLYEISKIDIALAKETKPLNENQLHQQLKRINAHEPIQHIIGFTYFRNRKFFVSSDVLIPRPETEELVDHVIQNLPIPSPKILEIGTGTGCIPISLYLEITNADITGIDISLKALEMAKKNAQNLEAHVKFIQNDFINDAESLDVNFDMLVSNPPYIAQKEKETMHSNVVDFEPHLALFVADQNPLIFYDTIAKFGLEHLNKNGLIVVEINAHFGQETADVFKNSGYNEVKLLKDFYDKDRFILAKK